MSVPALRFKEFNGEWAAKKLSDVASRIGDGLHSTPLYDESGDYYFVNGNNLTNNKIEINESTKRLSNKEYLKHKIELSSQTILMSINGTIGNLAFFNNEQVVLGKSACYINLKANENKRFVFNLLQTSNIKSYFDKELTGSTIKNLSLTTIKNTSAFFPCNEEQTKIANFLTAVDEKITQLTKKYDLLTQYKKGVMQQIFSQELRFKDDDGVDFPEWELSELGKFINEFKDKSTIENQHRVLTSARTGLIPQDEYFEEGRLSRKENLGFNIVPQGFVTYRSRSDDGIFKFNLNELGYTGVISTYYPVFNLVGCSNKFFIELTEFYRDDFGKYSVGTSQTVLSLNVIKKIKFKFPCFDEQTKIANLLKVIDDKITVTQTQLQAVKQYKQGLLQQMFV